MVYDVVVLGAGAAGLYCAARAGQRGKRAVVLEHQPDIGKKILISGGGRCNFTNRHTAPENFLSQNPHFCKSALARHTPQDFVALVERHRIPYHEKTLGQLFCDRNAREVVEMLREECRAGAVELVTNCRVQTVSRADHFQVETSRGLYEARTVVVATGGMSIPKIGATDFGIRLAKQFGHRVEPCRPALVPMTFAEPDRAAWCDLAGVATDVIAHAQGPSFQEKLLITHRGLSGPAVLQASSYWQAGQPFCVDLLPNIDLERAWACQRTEQPTVSRKTLLNAYLPKRLTERVLTITGEKIPVPQLATRLHQWRFQPNGTEGFAKAEVMAGGVSTGDLSSKTLESRRVPGLYFIGEVVDVTGHLGGYNFQWAWASAHCAAEAL